MTIIVKKLIFIVLHIKNIYNNRLIFLLFYSKQKYPLNLIFFFIKNMFLLPCKRSQVISLLKRISWKCWKTLFLNIPSSKIIIVHIHILDTQSLTVDKRRNYSFEKIEQVLRLCDPSRIEHDEWRVREMFSLPLEFSNPLDSIQRARHLDLHSIFLGMGRVHVFLTSNLDRLYLLKYHFPSKQTWLFSSLRIESGHLASSTNV